MKGGQGTQALIDGMRPASTPVISEHLTISCGSTEPDPEWSPVYSDSDLWERAPFEHDERDDDLKARFRALNGIPAE